MSSKPNLLAALAEAVICKEINEIVVGAYKSLQVIEPWIEAEADHPQLQQAIQKIQAHSVVYFEAIGMSIKTAQDEYGFSTNAIALCGFLLEKSTKPADLKEYIADMLYKANSAHKDSERTLEMFRDVRRGLIEVIKTIPKEAPADPQESTKILVRFASRISGETRDVEIDEAFKELNATALDMKNLSDNVDKFAGWWAGMGTMLLKLKEDHQELKPGKNRLLVKSAQDRWTYIQGAYHVINNDAYIIAKILRLQDHIPSEIDANTLITTNDGQGVKKSPENVTSTQKDHEQQNNHGKSILRSLPDLEKLVKDMADDAEMITVSLYNLQKDVSEANAVSFSNVRTELSNGWKFLRTYLERCHSFGEDVIILKDVVGSESAEDLLGFLDDMKASANEILDISEKLKKADLSGAFSKGLESVGSGVQASAKSDEQQRANLDTFFSSVGQPGHKSCKEIDISLRNLRAGIEEVYKFWKLTSQGFSALINDKGTSLTKADAEGIAHNWNRYQEATEKAISSLTKASDAALIAAEDAPTQRLVASSAPSGMIKDTSGGRFGRGWSPPLSFWIRRFI